MDIQTVIVIVLGLVAALYLIRKYTRAARSAGSCGCGCDGGSGCPAAKRGPCGDGK